VAERGFDLAGARAQDMSAGSMSVAPASVAASPDRPASRVWRRLATPGGLGALVGLALGALALGPSLARGFVLSYDMVFVPAPPFSARLLGFGGQPARAVPSDLVITAAARLLPADLVQKIVLLLIFVLACSGAAALLAASRPRSRTPLLACLASGVFYAWNPFVAERLLIGQWALLLGYAGLPWVLREVSTGPTRLRTGRLVLALLPAAVGGFAAMTITALAIVPAALARGTGQERVRRLATAALLLGLLSLPWLIPSLIVPVHTSPAGVNLFAPRADTPFGRIGSLVMLSGIWNAQTVPRGYGGDVASACWLALVLCALGGYLLRARAERTWAGVGIAGVAGLVVASIGITPVTRAALRYLVGAWSGFAVFRDGQQFVAALALTEAIGLGVLIIWVLESSIARSAAPSPAAKPVGSQQSPGGSQPSPAGSQPRRAVSLATPAALIAVLAVLAPLVLLPGIADGLGRRLRAVQYPADWLAARRLIDDSRQPGSVLVLPWGAYRRYPWNNHGQAVYDPWNKLLGREVISDDGLQVGDMSLPTESVASTQLALIIAAPGSLTGPLRAAGVGYVIVDAGPLLRLRAGALDRAARLPGADLILASRDLVVFSLRGPG
jgi:hypothetical protein